MEPTKNDVFRKEYKPLTEEQRVQMEQVKTKAQELWDLVESFIPGSERSERARLANMGKTQLELGVMAIVKAITTPQA